MEKKRIGIFTASTPIGSLYPKRLSNAISFLEKQGHQIIQGNLITKSENYRSGSIDQRVREIETLLDNNVDILLASIGGFNSSSLLPFLPYEKINKQKIIVCGFSDTTAILNAVIKNCPKARAIYSPALMPNFGEMDSESRNTSYECLTKIIEEDFIEIKALNFFYTSKENWNHYKKNCKLNACHKNKSEWKVLNVNKKPYVKGILFGGNGSTLSYLLGSDFVVKFPKNGILFLEDAEKTDQEVERIFTSFLNHGILDKAKAIILGKHDDYKGQRAPWEILKEILDCKNLTIPIIYDVDVSHNRPMLALELNKKTIINFKEKTIFQYINDLSEYDNRKEDDNMFGNVNN